MDLTTRRIFPTVSLLLDDTKFYDANDPREFTEVIDVDATESTRERNILIENNVPFSEETEQVIIENIQENIEEPQENIQQLEKETPDTPYLNRSFNISFENIIEHSRRRTQQGNVAAGSGIKKRKELYASEDKDKWVSAYGKELEVLESVGKLTVVDRPQGVQVIPFHEVFELKNEPDGPLTRPKVRLTTRGDFVNDIK
eukprot:augustus_masked-scaffold_34-processed-gene-1.5-mRNA-1 protein AED:0.31 eAED:0.31 QI:0/-1/0/1/-1/1/1/0/199